ncbi:uncharacterized protein LOC120079213 [Benincasa hispida]|uniref:uncharacterized protein LOC120079213 n=1 Tax=Benincasa hispida TaxID=102211 RepID=UPI0019022815|nr:uncharacterized protein LOC120079213 [Benincasa hispida]
MISDLNGTVVIFTKENFLLVTGLWWSPNPIVMRRYKGSRSLRNRYLRNDFAGDIHIGTLEIVYKEMEFENDMDAMKMTLVYYTELAMMGREKTRANVDKTLLIDMKDLDYLNSMDWGNVLWERTLLGLQRGLSGKSENYKKRSKINKNYIVKYNLSRFPRAFQTRITPIPLIMFDMEGWYRDTLIDERPVYERIDA